MEENFEELEDIKQFIKGEEAAVELFKKLNECRHSNITEHLRFNGTELYCPLVFDGWLCWNATPAGARVYNPCPGFITGFDPHKTAFKDCDVNGSWFLHPDTGKPWSNYSTCIDFDDLEWRKTINWVYMSGYSLSLVALLLSIFILAYFRALHCTRNILHINLFSSFSINNLLWLIWYFTVVPYPDVVTDNGAWCQSLFIVTHYFMLTNYFWMLCEGFYLHSLLAFAFIMEEQLLKYVYVIGWAVPFIAIAGYATLRIVNDDNRDCWIHESSYSHILIIPVVISLCINLVFLVSILRVLLLKIKTNTTQGQNRNELIKVFRAAFVLVPLLGLHYMIILFRPENDPYWERSHEILSAVSASYQGLCVACLFCFLNNEVHVQIKRKWYQFRDIPSNQVFSTVTGSTYALERRATRSSQTTVLPQNNEISPMLGEEKSTSPFRSDEKNNHVRLIDTSSNGIKNVVIRNKKSVSLVTDQNYKNKSFPNDDVTMLPMKKPLIGSNEKLYRENNTQIAEDYV